MSYNYMFKVVVKAGKYLGNRPDFKVTRQLPVTLIEVIQFK